jgi:hypothetical protein
MIMASMRTTRLATGAVLFGGLLAGVTANRALVEMPAWERLGVLPWANFLRAENHGVGTFFYAVIGLITLLFTIGAAIAFYFDREPQGSGRIPIYTAAALATAYAIITRAILVPANFRIGAVGDNAGELQRIFQKIALWWGVNDALHVITFGLSVWALIEILSSQREGAPAAARTERRASVSGVMGD